MGTWESVLSSGHIILSANQLLIEPPFAGWQENLNNLEIVVMGRLARPKVLLEQPHGDTASCGLPVILASDHSSNWSV